MIKHSFFSHSKNFNGKITELQMMHDSFGVCSKRQTINRGKNYKNFLMKNLIFDVGRVTDLETLPSLFSFLYNL